MLPTQADMESAPTTKGVRTNVRIPLPLYVLSCGNIAFLREEDGTRSVTEGARATMPFAVVLLQLLFHRYALSLSQLR